MALIWIKPGPQADETRADQTIWLNLCHAIAASRAALTTSIAGLAQTMRRSQFRLTASPATPTRTRAGTVPMPKASIAMPASNGSEVAAAAVSAD
jgi:hypothetical protein